MGRHGKSQEKHGGDWKGWRERQWKKGPEGLSGAGQEAPWRPRKGLGFILGVI